MGKEYKLSKVSVEKFGNVLKKSNEVVVDDKYVKIVIDSIREIKKDLPEEVVTLSAHMGRDIQADSLDMMDIALEIEERSGKEIPDDVVATIQTVSYFVLYIAD